MSRVALVTDSASYIPIDIRERFGIVLVSLHIQLDGKAYSELDIEPRYFYERVASGASVSTSQPSPGDFIQAYKQAADRGAEQILSVHIGGNLSGTVQSATLAAETSAVPVTVVDTGQASFAEGLCVLEAAEALSRGASAEEAAELTIAASRNIGNTFVVGAVHLAQRSGRMAAGQEISVAGVPVMALTAEGMKVLTSADSLEDAVETMAGHIKAAAEAADGRPLRVGIGHGDAPQIAEALRARVATMPQIEETIDYIVGPAVGAHVGPGNAGAVFIARPLIL